MTIPIPPTTQSAVETAACPRSYVEIVINGHGEADSIPSERGADCHHVMSKYIQHCAKLQVPSDWAAFDKLAAASGPDAGPILDRVRDTYRVNWQRVYGTEVSLAMDEECNPAYHVVGSPRYAATIAQIPGTQYSEALAAYVGTLDVIEINENATAALIGDFKSTLGVFNADSFQGKLYSYSLMRHIESLERVEFKLNFLRYRNCFRSITYTRADMPELQAAISRARERQRLIHANPEAAKPIPCDSCSYCPLAKALKCPIGAWNERTAMDDSTRLMALEYGRRMRDIHLPILRAHAQVLGPISYRDGNGRVYTYGREEVPETRYPLDREALRVLEAYAQASGEDFLDGRLSISSTKLKPLLEAKKREALKEIFEESLIVTSTKPKYAVRKPDGVIDDNPHLEEEQG